VKAGLEKQLAAEKTKASDAGRLSKDASRKDDEIRRLTSQLETVKVTENKSVITGSQLTQ